MPHTLGSAAELPLPRKSTHTNLERSGGGIDLGRSSHLSICSSDLHSASTKLLRMVSYVVQTLLFLIWRTLIFRVPVDSSHVRTMIVPPGQSCCIFTSARLFLIIS
ncbi:unnamed protein product [Microthlaspi erraticum]|uniref:Uncharacterized protein n=1 Tax=Microthlaspi erraticum TaxID=1685480 RepID=A0A6D2LG52_9BRAS|nr:unnamed protein product [Microthlaspi erraticum]